MPILLVVIAVCVAMLVSLSNLGKPVVRPMAVPAQFAGMWTVTGSNGQTIGTATLSADGRYDDGEFQGT
mgnify:FL=1